MRPHLPWRQTERRDLRLWPVGTVLALAFATAIAVAGAVFFVGWDLLGAQGLKSERRLTSQTLFDLVKLSFGAVAGAGALVALVVAYRRQRVDEDGVQRETTRLHTERFTTAVSQLGEKSAAVRLGGVHALTGLADDAPTRQLRQTCIDVLCAYLRLPYAAADDLPQGDAAARHEHLALREVRHTVIRLIRDHLRLPPEHPHSWQGHDLDFTGVTFDGGDFGGAVFSGGRVTFDGAQFSKGMVDFRLAQFSGGTVSFVGAVFSGCRVNFGGAKFTEGMVAFAAAVFSGGRVAFDAAFSGGTVDFVFAEFSGGTVDFLFTEFSGSTVIFDHALFSDGEVSFDHGQFSGGMVSFDHAQFSGGGVDFRRAWFSGGTVSFDHAQFLGGTLDLSHVDGVAPTGLIQSSDSPLPSGLSLPSAWYARGP
ncbi:pentapeptide repeat-containing protein [Streptomyces solisilvae]|uniref:pentapeptide repeat-containing protein n=1 Tax=Streptomyces malaysiensis TaxID=92644 RepID=UPI00331FA8F8